MKHIISLSLKYIRRQKLRTVLTFLCVTLSVFILCSFGAYMGSGLQTALNQCKRVGGSYEVSIDNWLNNVDDKEEALDIVKNHIVVSDYYIHMSSDSKSMSNRLENDGKILYFEFSDSQNIKRVSRLFEYSSQGNENLMGEIYGGYGGDIPENGELVPSWLEDLGYSVGDTVTFTLKPVMAEIDEDSQIIKDVRQKLFDEFGTSVVKDDPEYSNIDSEERQKTYRGELRTALSYYKVNLDEVPLKNEEYGETVEFTLQIAGFEDTYLNDAFDVIGTNTDDYYFKEFFEKNPDILGYENLSADIRINDNIDFDDGLIRLYGALGFNEGNYYSDLPKLNNELLFFEFRSVGSIVEILPLLLVFFVLIFFAWLVARFVIDNAFEISSQERSSQYAALRIMGASKSQISALVFTESLFYTLTAVPLGTATAYLFCNTSFTSFRKMGFQDFEFKANPYFVIGGIILCIVAIFISAYTSAMWASRKLSPAEALNFGKPKKKYKKSRRRKSKINLNSKKFLRRYTNKNIMRNKGRYIISTITMTLGVLFFTFSLMLGIYFYSEIKGIMENNNNYDFRLSFDSLDIDEAEKIFRDEKIFSKAEIYASSSSAVDINKTPVKEFEKLHPYDIQLPEYFQVTAVDRYYFDENMAELCSMTYDEFLQSGGGIYFISSFGNLNPWQYDDKDLIPQYEEYYKPLETPLSMTYEHNDYDVEIIGSMCADFETGSFIIIPIDSPLTKNLSLTPYIKARVNGQENYEEAEAIYNKFVDEYNPWDYYNSYMICTGLSEFVSAIIKVAVSFIMSIWLVGILSMVNSINTSVLNRSRELMMLRSIGMSRKQLRKTVILESIMFSSVSSSVGTILALLAYFIVMSVANFEPVMLVSMSVGLIISIAVNIAVSVFAAIPGIRSLEKAESLVKAF